jgi:hypothetical protein
MTTLAEGTVPTSGGTQTLANVVSVGAPLTIATSNTITFNSVFLTTSLLIEATSVRQSLSNVVSVAIPLTIATSNTITFNSVFLTTSLLIEATSVRQSLSNVVSVGFYNQPQQTQSSATRQLVIR